MKGDPGSLDKNFMNFRSLTKSAELKIMFLLFNHNI